MKEIYQKTAFFSLIISIGTLLFCLYYYFFHYDRFSQDGNVIMQFSILSIASLISGLYFRKVAKKLKNQTEVMEKGQTTSGEEILSQMKGLILQRIPSSYLQAYLMDRNGQPLFKIDLAPTTLWKKLLLFFPSLEKGFLFFPVQYELKTMDDQLIATFCMKQQIQQTTLQLKNNRGDLLATFVQNRLKVKNIGVLYDAQQRIWRELCAKNTYGDIDVFDEDGNLTANYRFGRFPYALDEAFEATTNHSYVQLGSQISTEEKLAYVMIFFFWLV